MCGILGYIGDQPAVPLLIHGLRRLEYRGYDSAGVAALNGHGLEMRKSIGRIDNLAKVLASTGTPEGTLGICHTRWATHGGVSDENAHPHTDQSGKLALVHNGVIENYRALQEGLLAEGHTFIGQTDTEVLAHLIGKYFDEMVAIKGAPSKELLLESLRKALGQVSGTYGIALFHEDVPDAMIAARRGSPLVIGVGDGENFIGSDVAPLVAHTQRAVYLNDYDLAIVTRHGFDVTTLRGGVSSFEISEVEMSESDVELGNYPHYMLKEIFEQPESITNTLRGRLDHDGATAVLGGFNMTPRELSDVDRIVFTACGTALHSGMLGEYLVEHLAHLPCEVEFASEFRYRNIPITRNTLVIAISQSGETIDTLHAMRETQRKGYRTLGIVNTVGSTIARESDGGSYLYAGPEIGVAATKSFTCQVTLLSLLALLLGRIRFLSPEDGSRLIEGLENIPGQIREILKLNDHIRDIAYKYADCEGLLYMGRQLHYPVALEGALKIKEIAYKWASGHPSAELKHGYIAMVKPEVPSVFIAPSDSVFEKNMSNIQEVKARKGPVIAIGTEGSKELERLADDVIFIPKCEYALTPILAAIPLQLFAYHMAVKLGCDVDKPRNLAKSVTVE